MERLLIRPIELAKDPSIEELKQLLRQIIQETWPRLIEVRIIETIDNRFEHLDVSTKEQRMALKERYLTELRHVQEQKRLIATDSALD